MVAVGLFGCAGGPGPSKAGPVVAAPAGEPFAPVVVRIHPLTHADAAAPGLPADRCVLVLHFELKDRFGDTVKGLGKLRAELYRPGPAPGAEKQELSWEFAELANPERNAARFDQATRTYRVPLSAPRWVAERVARPGGEATWLKVRVVFTAIDAAGSERFLEDEFVM